MRHLVIVGMAVILVAACAGPASSRPSDAPGPGLRSPEAAVSPVATRTLSPGVSLGPSHALETPTIVAPAPTPTPTASLVPRTLGPDMVAVVVTDDLVMRSEAGTGASSVVFKPWLQRRVQLYVLSGPVRANGYQWFEVMPLSAKYEESGWVAAASRSGEPWIRPATSTPACPDPPSTIAGLDRLASAVRLACFSGIPITIRARIIRDGVETTDAFFDPDMFNVAFDPEADAPTPLLLIDPQDDPQAYEDGPMFWLYLDPTAPAPKPLPIGAVVSVTGIFDHPAAKGCTWSSMIEPVTEPAEKDCRPRFVVTQIASG